MPNSSFHPHWEERSPRQHANWSPLVRQRRKGKLRCMDLRYEPTVSTYSSRIFGLWTLAEGATLVGYEVKVLRARKESQSGSGSSSGTSVQGSLDVYRPPQLRHSQAQDALTWSLTSPPPPPSLSVIDIWFQCRSSDFFG